MILQINSLEDVKKLNKDIFTNNDIEKIVIMGIDASSQYSGILKLSSILDNLKLRKAAMDWGLLDVAEKVLGYDMCFAYGLEIDSRFRSSLSEKDKIVLGSTWKLMKIADEFIKEV